MRNNRLSDWCIKTWNMCLQMLVAAQAVCTGVPVSRPLSQIITKSQQLACLIVKKWILFTYWITSAWPANKGGILVSPGFLPPASEGWRKVMFSLCPPFRGGGTPSQVWVGGGYPISGLGRGVPHPRSRWGGGYPIPGSGRGGTPSQVYVGGVPPPDLGWGIPPDLGPGTPPKPDQHSEHLLRGGRYASCVHAGGLSCFLFFLTCFSV